MCDLVTIATFTTPWETHILSGRVEAEGILARLIDEGTGGPYQIFSIRLMVPAADAKKALEILREGETVPPKQISCMR